MTTQTNNIYAQLKDMIDRGTEEDVRNFFVDNLEKFPQNVQVEIVGAFFEEQLENTGGDADLVEKFQGQGVNMRPTARLPFLL
ncbi:MAG: hypothetical protein HY007_02440 [Candidatus Sungbacteria bacterium]|nr:hypothetical protein [Candidatus Sungbacteria bacterium]